MLGEVVGFVETAFFPMNKELPLAYAVANPVEAHVDGFRALLFDSVVGDAGGGTVVGLDWCRWLGVAEFLERGTDGAGFLAVVEEAGKFSFGGT